MNHARLLIMLVLSICWGGVSAQEPPSSSNLAAGKIYRLEIPNSGIYQLTYSHLVNNLNISAGELRPNNIRILSSGEGIVPPKNNTERPFDPVPVPSWYVGMEDGSFDPGDKLVFFAPGPDNIQISPEGLIEKRSNPFDFSGYIFVQIGSEISPAPLTQINPGSDPQLSVREIQRFRHHEQDLVNLQDLKISNHGTGQRWFGESFSNNRKQDFTDILRPNEAISPNQPAHIAFHFAARASRNTRLNLTVNGENTSYSLSGINVSHSEHPVADSADEGLYYNLPQLDQVSLEYFPSSGNDQAWLDYITFNYFTSELDQQNNSSFFVAPTSQSNFEVTLDYLGSSNSPQIINITHFPDYYTVPVTRNNNQVKFQDNGTSDLMRYAAFDPDQDYPLPNFVNEVANQNLKTMNAPKCLVVYADFLEPAVDRWVAHRSEYSQMSIAKAEIQTIYNEFSGGKVDPGAIRDFVRYLHEKDENFEYLLLFGAASFDYRHINKNHPNTNIIPTYQTAESYHPIFGYPTDDFFGLIRPGQGGDLVGSLAINVGRLPARNLEEAYTMVDKIIRYETTRSARGDWQNRFIFLADDGDNNVHLRDADNISESVRKDSSLIVEKIYFDAYKRVNGASGVRFPDASAKLNQAIQRGALVVNYLGHGGPYGWASERVLTNDDVQSWTNSEQLPLFITATCTFGTYDQPALESTGELLINKGSGGAIALFTTSRPVYSSSNRRLTASTFNRLFEKDEKGFIPIGKVLTRAKNSSSQDTLRANARKYTLLGDPTMRILLPNYQIITTSFNGNNAQLHADTIRPLERVTVQGYVADMDGLPVADYNGIIAPTLFDKVSQSKTLGQSSDSQVRSFNSQENVLWKGKVPVEAGQFEFTMVVPKSINEEIDQGKIQYFATSNTPGMEDAKGAYTNFLIGGIPEDTVLSPTPPVVDLYLENEMFENGERVGPNPMMYVKLFDSLGMNLSNNGLGKEMVAILDGNTNEPIILNSFYEPDVDDSRGGTIFYPLSDLSPGYHSIKVRAWNILGLKGESEIEFFVIDQNEDELFEVSAYPNPFTDRVCVRLKSQLPVGKYNGFLEVFNSSGQIVDEVPVGFLLEGSEIPCIEWRPASRNQYLYSGTYYARIRIEKNTSSDVLYSPVLKLIKI